MKTLNDFIRPSSLYAIDACPGRPTMEAAAVNIFGEPEADPAANMGTQAHAITAEAINLWKETQEEWGEIITKACNQAIVEKVDPWTVRCIQMCLEFARDLIAKHEIQSDDVLVEEPLGMSDLGMERVGTADLILVIPFEHAIVCDWKFTFLDAGDADDHEQLQAYGISASATFMTDKITVYLFQPRAPKKHRASAASFDAATLRESLAWTRSVVARARADNPELKPSYSACCHCRALPTCSAAKERIMQAKEALTMMGTPTDPSTLGELCDAAKLAEKWADAAKDLCKAEMIKGNKANGYKLGTSRNIRSVSDPMAAAIALEAGGFSLVKLMQLQALTVKCAALPPEAEALVQIVERPSSPSIVAEKRPTA